MIIPLRAGLRAAIKRNVTIRNTGWPYNTPIYTGIPPVFSCIGAMPDGASPMAKGLIRQYDQLTEIDRDLHRQAGRADARQRDRINDHRRQVRAQRDDVYRKIIKAGWARYNGLHGDVWRPAKHR